MLAGGGDLGEIAIDKGIVVNKPVNLPRFHSKVAISCYVKRLVDMPLLKVLLLKLAGVTLNAGLAPDYHNSNIIEGEINQHCSGHFAVPRG